MAPGSSDSIEVAFSSPCPTFSPPGARRVPRDTTIFIARHPRAGLAVGDFIPGSFTVIVSIAIPERGAAYTGLAGSAWGVASVIGLLVEGQHISHVL
ncbi:uncharacterized protein EAF01_003903 [Botrytis porri]|uniref:uncharacterized protein n=1 Tax=Botrytis porri TaxID=87229 RepID=UPI0019012801|nr:uncharacterized protein EAF01_003903 [Botrytis porri]KAF7908148.1 hypothetical protein EAF01_003903 [Botrytis porri]